MVAQTFWSWPCYFPSWKIAEVQIFCHLFPFSSTIDIWLKGCCDLVYFWIVLNDRTNFWNIVMLDSSMYWISGSKPWKKETKFISSLVTYIPHNFQQALYLPFLPLMFLLLSSLAKAIIFRSSLSACSNTGAVGLIYHYPIVHMKNQNQA